MKIPKYIVFRVDVMRKGTSVELTNITDDVEDVILKAEQTESQMIDQAKADIEKWSSWSKTYEAMCKDEPQTDCKDCKYAWWNGERYVCTERLDMP